MKDQLADLFSKASAFQGQPLNVERGRDEECQEVCGKYLTHFIFVKD